MDKVIVQAYKHQPTGRLFHTEEDYLKFEEQYNKGKEKTRMRKERKRNWISFISEPRLNAVSIEDFKDRYKRMLKIAYEDTIINTSNIDFSFQFVDSITTSALIYPISRPDCPHGSILPGWTVKVSNYSPINCYAPNPFNLDIDLWGHSGFHPSGSVCYLFLEDFPLIYERVKETYDRINELTLLKAHESSTNWFYCADMDEYIHSHPEVREGRNTIESLTTQIKRIEETIEMCSKSLVNMKNEARAEFIKKNPRDLKLPDKIELQIKYLKSTIKL